MCVFSQTAFLVCAGLLLSSACRAEGQLQRLEKPTSGPAIVIGFVGGFVRHDDVVHSPVQLAAHLRAAYPMGVHVEVYENRRREEAHKKILNLLDTNQDGVLSEEEKQKARIIIYGMSWGGAETVALARELGRDGIPVLLTVQVDSITKIRQTDKIIPPNVGEAANFYQPNGLLHGQAEIRAADETRTRILGNFRFEYKSKSIRCDRYPWYDRAFAKYHTEIECDPVVWNQIEALIRSKLPAVNSATARDH